MFRHVDYAKNYAANILPVIPLGAKLAPTSKVHPDSVGKVPGIERANGWTGMHWRTVGEVTLHRAQGWDKMGAAVGFRSGPNGVFAVDVDINVKDDSASVLHIAVDIFGNQVAVRHV